MLAALAGRIYDHAPQQNAVPFGAPPSMVDPNYDPRDDRESRPQVGFAIDVTNSTFRARFLELSDAWVARGVRYRDMMGFDPDSCVIRFHWDDAELVDPTARWLSDFPFISNVRAHYGGRHSGPP